jgi:hypothetical protein
MRTEESSISPSSNRRQLRVSFQVGPGSASGLIIRLPQWTSDSRAGSRVTQDDGVVTLRVLPFRSSPQI